MLEASAESRKPNEPPRTRPTVPPPAGDLPPGIDAPATTVVPPLEPPAPLQTRIRVPWRRRLQGLWRDTPCWLTSLAFHLALMVVLGALIPSVSRRGHEALVILAGFATAEPEKRQPVEIAVRPSPAQPQAEPAEPQTSEASPEEEPSEGPPPPPPPPTPPAPVTHADSALRPPAAPQVSGQRRLVKAINSYVAAKYLIHTTEVPPHFARITEMDSVVDRFIEYDIGRLKGEEARKALRDFNQLSESALPALVRGLNKSAAIQASCPVVVLMNRVERELNRTGDAALIRYALENIGRNINRNAPHARRILQMRDRLRKKMFNRESTIRNIMKQQGLQPDPRTLSATTRLLNKHPDAVGATLSLTSETARRAGLLALSIRQLQLTPRGRDRAVERIIAALRVEKNPALRRQEHLALSLLTSDYIKKLPRDEGGAPAKLADRWASVWKTERSRIRSRHAEDLLRAAEKARARSEHRTALRKLIELRKHFPDTEQARKASEQLQSLAVEPVARSRLKMAKSLANNGRYGAARRRLREILRDFPETDAAREAKSVLDQLQSASLTE